MSLDLVELGSLTARNGFANEDFVKEEFNNWRFSILVDNKEKILDDIFKIEGLFASSHYPQVDYNYSSNPIKNPLALLSSYSPTLSKLPSGNKNL